jgi:arylsulfatase A-like enzyme
MHDPLGHGHVYHRAGSFAPGRTPIEGDKALTIGGDLAGDRAAVERFVDDVVAGAKPAFALAWLGHPDTTQHEVPLGSPEHHEALAVADGHAGQVVAAVDAARRAGEDVLLIVGSDHGHQTVSGVVDIAADLVAARLKDSAESADVVVAPNGTAALVYVDRRHADRIPRLAEHLGRAAWAGRVIGPADLERSGVPAGGQLAFAVAMASDDEARNAFGVPGLSLAAKPADGKPDRLGCGQHGGFGRHEQSPFLIIDGPGFAAGSVIADATSAIDVAPTVLAFLGHSTEGLDGRRLQATPPP